MIYLISLMMNVSDLVDSLGFQGLIFLSLNLVSQIASLESFMLILFEGLSWELKIMRGRKIHIA
jgi:hypothetical protein